MLPAAPSPVLACCLWALPTAALAAGHFALGAVAAATGMLAALASARPGLRAGAIALPAFLAAARPALPPPPPNPPPGPVAIAGEVARIVRTPVLGGCVVHLARTGEPLRLYCDDDLDALPGDRLAGLACAGAPAAPGVAPPLRAVVGTLAVTPGPASIRRAGAAARRALERQLLALLPGEAGALVGSLVLGRDTRPGDEAQAAHRATGLSHLLAVSGAHAAMLAFLLGGGGGRGRRKLLASRTRTLAVLGALAVYALVTGGEPPVLRAVVGFGLAALAVHLGRPCGAAALLAAPALFTVLAQPAALTTPSFLLSYAAVAGLLLAGADAGRTFTQRWLVAPLRASAWATLLTAPLTLWFFGQIAPWTVALTPLLAPLVGALLLGGLSLACLGLVAPATAAAVAPAIGHVADLYLAAVVAGDGLPGTPLPALCAPGPVALAGGLATALAVLWRRPDRVGAALAAALLAAPHFAPLGSPGPSGLHLAAVGHGQACLLRFADGRQVAVDCGSLQSPRLAAERLVAAMPHRRLDLLVVTHADVDHHGGVGPLLERTRVAAAVLPTRLAGSPLAALLAAHGAAVEHLLPGERATPWPALLVGAPQLPAGAADNDHSLWVRADLGATSVLLTGDAQELGVAAALAQGLAPPADALVLPHHGRANANAARLLAAVSPRLALASAATGDGATRLGALLAARGVPLWTTGLCGAIWLPGAPHGAQPVALGPPP
jgi:competence protein ComEC